MKILLLVLLLLLLAGPLRRPYLRNARFTVPATIGTVAGLALGGFVAAAAGLPPHLSILLTLAVTIALAASLGEATKNWFDQVLGRRD